MSNATTDPIADMLARIRNAIAVNKNEVSLPYSKVKESIAQLLKDNRYIDKISVTDATIGKSMKLVLNHEDESARITEIVRLSKPGRRQYTGSDEIPIVKRGRGVVILSTSKGMMTGTDAKRQRIGGELICRVY